MGRVARGTLKVKGDSKLTAPLGLLCPFLSQPLTLHLCLLYFFCGMPEAITVVCGRGPAGWRPPVPG